MATRFIDKEYGTDSLTAITDSASNREKVRNLPDAAGFVYDSVDGFFKYNDAGAIRTLVNTNEAQTLTNKTLTSPVVTGDRQDVQIYLTEATTTLTAAESGKVVIATRASATQTFTLPIATTEGMVFVFICGNAGGEILVTPNAADTMLIKATEDAGASILTSAGAGIKNTAATNVIGDHIHLVSDGVSRWYMIGQSGIWAAQ